MSTTPAGRPPAPGFSADLAVKWARQNLFSSRTNTALTVLIGLFLVWLVPKLISWALLDAVFQPDAEACRATKGACWGFISEKLRLMTFGTYPYAEQWRPLAMMVLMVGLFAATLMQALRGRWLWIGWAVGVPVMWLLMGGGQIRIPWLVILSAALAPICIYGARHANWKSNRTRSIAAAATVLLLIILTISSTWQPVAIDTGLAPVETEKWGGLPLTLILSANGIVFSFPLAVLLALGRASELPAIRALCITFIELVRGVPLITVLFMASLMIPLFLPSGFDIDKLLRAQIGFILFAAAYEAEVIRGGLQAVPKGQYEAADALGLGYWHKTGLIILPQALRVVIPPMVNTFIGFFKDTSLVIIIGLFDFLGAIRLAASDADWRSFYVEGLMFAALVYFAFCYAMASYARHLERRLDPGRR